VGRSASSRPIFGLAEWHSMPDSLRAPDVAVSEKQEPALDARFWSTSSARVRRIEIQMRKST
jgi:hypothetical protein